MLWSWIGDLTMYRWPYAVCGWCVPSVCRELELTVWVMWRPCKVDVRCHQEAASYHIPLKIWDSAPTPLSRYNKRCRAPCSTHGHLDDIEHLPYKDVTSPKQWVRALYKPRAHTIHIRHKATGTSWDPQSTTITSRHFPKVHKHLSHTYNNDPRVHHD